MKTWLQRGVSLLLICLLAGPIAIQADTIEKIILTAKENQVETVLIPSDTKDTIRSLQLSFQIKAKQGKVLKEHVQFRFHRDIKSDVQEWRYQEDTGRLTIYLSGDEHLYAQDELRLGMVELKLAAGTKAEVSVIEDSLKTVNDVYAVNEVSGMDAIAPVTIEKAEINRRRMTRKVRRKENRTFRIRVNLIILRRTHLLMLQRQIHLRKLRIREVWTKRKRVSIQVIKHRRRYTH